MNKKYFVKTRNWHCKKWVFTLLNLSKFLGVYRGDSYGDGDGKFCLETNSSLKAYFTWGYFMLFYRFSGGWTYCLKDGLYILNSSNNYPSYYRQT